MTFIFSFYSCTDKEKVTLARPSYTYDSSRFDLEHQFEETARELSCLGNFRISSVSDTSLGFAARIFGYKLDPFVFLLEESDAYVKSPCSNMDFPSENNYCYITLRREGYSDVFVKDQAIRHQGNKLELGLAGESKKASISNHKSLTIYFSLTNFEGMEEPIKNLANIGESDYFSPLLAEFLSSVADILPYANLREQKQIADATKEIIRSAILSSMVTAAVSEANIMSKRLEIAKTYINSNLSSSQLSPSDLGAVLNVSRRQLFKIFEPVGGIGNYIRNSRLEAGWQEIVRSGGLRPVNAIAEELGFSEPSTFSKQFKAKFGCNPNALRERIREIPRASPSLLKTLF